MAYRKRKKRVETSGVEAEWFDLLAQPGSYHQAEPVPKGWMTSDEVATAWDLANATAVQYIKRMKDKGLVEVRDFKIMRDKVRPIPHYKILGPRPGSK